MCCCKLQVPGCSSLPRPLLARRSSCGGLNLDRRPGRAAAVPAGPVADELCSCLPVPWPSAAAVIAAERSGPALWGPASCPGGRSPPAGRVATASADGFGRFVGRSCDSLLQRKQTLDHQAGRRLDVPFLPSVVWPGAVAYQAGQGSLLLKELCSMEAEANYISGRCWEDDVACCNDSPADMLEVYFYGRRCTCRGNGHRLSCWLPGLRLHCQGTLHPRLISDQRLRSLHRDSSRRQRRTISALRVLLCSAPENLHQTPDRVSA